jgi:glycerophosphoryl diester phosphodiesterase
MHKPDGRPQVVAHRGSSQARAEHTLGAYVQAIEEGADALECDVRLTADGHLVCVHDRRVDRTTNARGIVSTMRLDQLADLDAASWKSPWADLDDEAVEVDETENKLLTLSRLLEVIRDYERPLELAIETKHPTRYAGLVERTLVDLLWKYRWTGAEAPVRVMSFSGVALNRVRKLAPEMEVVLLIEGQSWKVTRQVLGDDWIAGPGMQQLKDKPKLGQRLRRDGRRIHVWTVNTRSDLEICLDLGVEAVITDVPDRVLSRLA